MKSPITIDQLFCKHEFKYGNNDILDYCVKCKVKVIDLRIATKVRNG